MNHEEERNDLKNRIGNLVYNALIQVSGGGIETCVAATTNNDDNENNKSGVTSVGDIRRKKTRTIRWADNELRDLAYSSVSFSNKPGSTTLVEGKPHNIEVRAALTMFHKYHGGVSGAKSKKRRCERPPPTTPNVSSLQIISDLGLSRSVVSPIALAKILSRVLEEACRQEKISHDVRSNNSGIICIVTPKRAHALRQSGRLPCPSCIKWCKGTKGLWWHQQQEHGSEHSIAAASAASKRIVLAIVPYDENQPLLNDLQNIAVEDPALIVQLSGAAVTTTTNLVDAALKFIKMGHVVELVKFIRNNGRDYDPKTALDRNGASPLHWAAGSGQIDVCKCLIEQYGCSPEQGQRGKRSFSGRTPLHWAARNGHVSVVTFLVESCLVPLDATTADGTTAFCWACWQGHLQVMKFLHSAGCDIHKSNSFGCNAVLWSAQGGGDIDTMKWLASIGCEMTCINTNGHGALHKAAQRGRSDMCQWFCSSILLVGEILGMDTNNDNRSIRSQGCSEEGVIAYRNTTSPDYDLLLNLIGPDSDRCCPSDLAGIQGDDPLALWIASQEVALVRHIFAYAKQPKGNSLPETVPETHAPSDNKNEITFKCKWLMSKTETNTSRSRIGWDLELWEPGGGIRRMEFGLYNKE